MSVAVAAPARICDLTRRIKEVLLLTDGGSKELTRTFATKVDIDTQSLAGDIILERAFELCENAMSEVEDAGAEIRRRADRAEAVALMERQLRQQLEEKLAATKVSAEELGRRLHSASESVEALVAPLLEIGSVGPDVEQWGRERELNEAFVRDAEAKAQAAKDRLLALGDRLLEVPGAKRKPHARPQATDALEEIAAFCEAAVSSLKETAEEMANQSSDDEVIKSPSLKSSAGTFARLSQTGSTATVLGTEGSCSACSAPFGKRHLTRRHRCDFCTGPFCSSCSKMFRVCDGCFQEAKVGPGLTQRLDVLADQLRAAGGRKQRGTESQSLEEAVEGCEAAALPLKDMRAGSDVSHSLFLEIRGLLDENAKAAAAANADLGARLAVLCEKGPSQAQANMQAAVAAVKAANALMPGKGPPTMTDPGPRRGRSPLPPPPTSPTSNPASAAFWETSEPRITCSGV